MGKQKNRKYLPVYQWDIEGNLIYCHANMEVCMENLLITKGALRSCLKRKNCYKWKWYFSRTKEFTIPKIKFTHNPLHNKDSYHKKVTPDFSFDDEDDF